MKKMIKIMLAFAFLLSLSACKREEEQDNMIHKDNLFTFELFETAIQLDQSITLSGQAYYYNEKGNQLHCFYAVDGKDPVLFQTKKDDTYQVTTEPLESGIHKIELGYALTNDEKQKGDLEVDGYQCFIKVTNEIDINENTIGEIIPFEIENGKTDEPYNSDSNNGQTGKLEHNLVIDPGMSNLEKVKAFVKYAQTFPYNYNVNNYQDMLLKDGGECWANTDLLLTLCRQEGIPATVNTRSNTLSYPDFHINACILIDGSSYIVDVGHMNRNQVDFYAARGYSYTVNADNSATITNYEGYCSNLVIPSSIDGHVVTKIGNGAFKYHFELGNLTLPSGLVEIGNEAFKNCISLKQISFQGNPSQLVIADNAFLMEQPVYLGNTPLTMVPYSYNQASLNGFIGSIQASKNNTPSIEQSIENEENKENIEQPIEDEEIEE